jgi:hypothetical protein
MESTSAASRPDWSRGTKELTATDSHVREKNVAEKRLQEMCVKFTKAAITSKSGSQLAV